MYSGRCFVKRIKKTAVANIDAGKTVFNKNGVTIKHHGCDGLGGNGITSVQYAHIVMYFEDTLPAPEDMNFFLDHISSSEWIEILCNKKAEDDDSAKRPVAV